MMFKNAITLLIVVVVGISVVGCRRTPDNTETANANTAENPFANITDANQALAEGNRLLDEDQTEMAIDSPPSM